MRNFALRIGTLFLSVFAIATMARADGLTNNFDVGHNYVLDGIVGETNWDGIYLLAGDIPGGNNGGSGAGTTILADSSLSFGNFFSVRTTRGDWAGAGDDGFFIWKLVNGDFDVSVQSAPTWQITVNHFAGLLARAWNTNNTGAPYSTTQTNNAENWVMLWRAQEFNISQVRIATNATEFQRNFPDSIVNTNQTRYYRIVRQQETNFMFFWKTNLSDAWIQLSNNINYSNGVYVRPDLAGVKMQVGIAHAMFDPNNQATAFFTDFELNGPDASSGTGTPNLPGTPANLVTTATNIGGSLTLQWDVGTPGDSSLVVMRRTGRISINPIQGLTYNANSAFGNTNTLLGAGEFVVFNGIGNSVTVTNLAANNVTYTVAVYEYTNSGSGPVYNTAFPVTNGFSGPGIITSVSLQAVNSTNIPVNGAVSYRLLGNFSTGETNTDVTAQTVWSTSDATVADVAPGSGVANGVAVGSAVITATFGTFTPSLPVSVHAPAFSDTFSPTQDYLVTGIGGSIWDGMFLNFGDVSGAAADADGPGSTITLDSRITSPNGLYMSSVQSDWEGNGADGPFLFRIVPGRSNGVSGDFQASVHIHTMNTLNGVFAGIQARLYNPANGAAGGGGGENHVNYWKVQNGTTSVRRTQANGNTTLVGAGPAAANTWLLIKRENTNFYFYE